MISITNQNFHSAIDICGKLIKPQKSHIFNETDVDMDKINYYISTNDISIQFIEEKKNKHISRKSQTNDTIIIESNNSSKSSSKDTDKVSEEEIK